MPRLDWNEVISARTRHLPESEFEEILKLAAEGKGIISLGPGEPDFSTPKEIIDAACNALRSSAHASDASVLQLIDTEHERDPVCRPHQPPQLLNHTEWLTLPLRYT